MNNEAAFRGCDVTPSVASLDVIMTDMIWPRSLYVNVTVCSAQLYIRRVLTGAPTCLWTTCIQLPSRVNKAHAGVLVNILPQALYYLSFYLVFSYIYIFTYCLQAIKYKSALMYFVRFQLFHVRQDRQRVCNAGNPRL